MRTCHFLHAQDLRKPATAHRRSVNCNVTAVVPSSSALLDPCRCPTATSMARETHCKGRCIFLALYAGACFLARRSTASNYPEVIQVDSSSDSDVPLAPAEDAGLDAPTETYVVDMPVADNQQVPPLPEPDAAPADRMPRHTRTSMSAGGENPIPLMPSSPDLPADDLCHHPLFPVEPLNYKIKHYLNKTLHRACPMPGICKL